MSAAAKHREALRGFHTFLEIIGHPTHVKIPEQCSNDWDRMLVATVGGRLSASLMKSVELGVTADEIMSLPPLSFLQRTYSAIRENARLEKQFRRKLTKVVSWGRLALLDFDKSQTRAS